MPATVIARFFFFTLLVFLAGCSSTASIDSIWADTSNEASYTAVQLVVLTPNTRSREYIEKALLKNLHSAGYKAYPLDRDPVQTFVEGSDGLKNQIRHIAQANGADSALVIALLEINEVERYVEPHVITTPVTGSMSPFVNTMMITTMVPGYYDSPDTVYSIQSTLFDLASEKAVLKVQSKNINSASIEQGAEDFAQLLVEALHPDYLKKN